MPAEPTASSWAHEGDWIEVAGVPGWPSRRGQVTEVVGQDGREHYRVRWDEDHESLFFPSESTRIVHVHAG